MRGMGNGEIERTGWSDHQTPGEEPMIPLTPALLVGTASALIGYRNDPRCGGKPDCRNMKVDRVVRRLRARIGGDRAPWDAAFVHHAGYASHFDHRGGSSSWPIPARCSVHPHALAEFAREANILDPRPQAGDLFVLWCDGRRRFMHTGIVLHVGLPGEFPSGQAFVECLVLSPNVHHDGRIGGPDTLRLTRRISPDRGDWFIRWTELDGVRPIDEPETAARAVGWDEDCLSREAA